MLSREEVKGIPRLGNFNDRLQDECYQCPNGESTVECRERFHGCIMEICQESERNGHQLIGIGAHSFVMRQLLIKCNFPNISELSNCEIIKCAYNTESKTIEVLERIIARDQTITM